MASYDIYGQYGNQAQPDVVNPLAAYGQALQLMMMLKLLQEGGSVNPLMRGNFLQGAPLMRQPYAPAAPLPYAQDQPSGPTANRPTYGPNVQYIRSNPAVAGATPTVAQPQVNWTYNPTMPAFPPTPLYTPATPDPNQLPTNTFNYQPPPAF